MGTSGGEIPHYSLKRLATKSPPPDFEQLCNWLSNNGKTEKWDGKLYVASTIKWNVSSQEFRQDGCSPNYHARVWTLACCKHKMRTGRPFQGQVDAYNVPTFVFTISSNANSEGIQALLSVAKVTRAFKSMKAYAKHLKRNTRLSASRLTRQVVGDEQFGWRFGDCHADANGNVGAPCIGHVHRKHFRDKCWKNDNQTGHLILLSDDFILWSKPVFVTRKILGQSCYGTNMTPDKLKEMLTLYKNRS